MAEFQLHPQLAKDTLPVLRLRLSRLLLMNDRRFPWLILVPLRANIREIVDLLPGDQAVLWQEITEISRVMQMETGPLKLNVAMLGNQVPQLHVHIIARFENDAAWPKPVWGAGEAEAYPPEESKNVIERLNAAIKQRRGLLEFSGEQVG